MRLTLRTMLAYLDDILEPDDSEDIAKKIEESEFATGLMHRTRDCMRRLRLGAPPVMGRGMALDPNTVAEYLDNTLPSERVPDFEKVCLESDMHLAEVAACHQILTLVLGEPAEVDPASRERMYHVVSQPALAKSAEKVAIAAGSTPPAVPVDSRPPLRRAKPEVPDYLRERSRPNFWPVAATLLVAALLTLALLVFFGPQNMRSRIATLIAGTESGRQPPEAQPADQNPAAGAIHEQAIQPGSAVVNPQAESPPGSDAAVAPPETANVPPEEDQPTAQAATAAESEQQASEEGALPGSPEASDTGESGTTGDSNVPPEVQPGDASAASAKTGLEGTAAPETPEAGVGRYLSDGDVLLAFDPPAATWRRLASKANLASGDRLLVPPGFRPTLTLRTGITVQPIGPAVLVLERIDDSNVPEIAIDYGRFTMLTIGKPKNPLRLRMGDRESLITFGDRDSTLALDARGLLVTGKDPETTPAPITAELYATSGVILWQEADTVSELRAPLGKTITSPGAPEINGNEFPKWVVSDVLSALDRRGAMDLERDLSVDRPVSLSLKELAQLRRTEARSLAMRTLAQIGEFDTFVTALNDADQKLAWPGYIESLRGALTRGPDVAARVRAAFQKQRGADGAELYRMLWGYTPEQLQEGAAQKLVDYLSHSSLDFRVVSFWTLQNITGISGLYYRPENSDRKNRTPIQEWKRKLKDGKIVPAAVGPKSATGS